MTETAGAESRAGWKGALGLTVVVLFLSVLNALPLVVLPLAVLLFALPSDRRGKQAALGALLAVAVMAVPGGDFTDVTRGWGLALGGGYLLATMLRPRWGVAARAMATVAGAFLLGAVVLALTGSSAAFDAAVRERFASAAAAALAAFGQAGADGTAAMWRDAMVRVAELQWMLFPAVLFLESVAAVVLASWWVARVRGGDPRVAPASLTRFRFDDQLVWVLIAGLAVVLLPSGDIAARAGYNAITVMTGLYAARGLGVFLFLAGGAPSAPTVFFALLVGVFLYPFAVAATVMVGLADTWLDVRARAAAAPPA